MRNFDDVHFLIEKQNNDPYKRYCSVCGKGELLSEWKVVDYDIDRYHGYDDITITRKCPHCGTNHTFA